jgi:hypothetical protein
MATIDDVRAFVAGLPRLSADQLLIQITNCPEL